MKNLITILLLSLLPFAAVNAQSGKVVQQPADKIVPAHRIIFQMNTNDSLAHKQLMRQLANIQSVAPGTQMEVVCHGPGLEMVMTEKSVVTEKIKQFTKSGVVFNACEFAMKERKVEKSQIIPESGYVPSGLVEIVIKQEQGWSYIKSGF